MLKYLRQNNKKILAVLGVLLMIAFIIPSTSKRFGSLGRGRSPGQIAGKVITGDEAAIADAEWKTLLEVARTPLQSVYFGDLDLLRAAVSRGLTHVDYLLLLREANRMEMQPDPERVKAEFGGLSPDRFPRVEQAAMNWDMICQVIRNRIVPSSKISPVLAEHAQLLRDQEVRISYVKFDAKDFSPRAAGAVTTRPAATTQPTDAELAKFFDQFKGIERGEGEFGFGYRFPKRLKIEYVMIPTQVIRDRIGENSDVYRRFQQKSDKYRAFEPTTGPTTRSMTKWFEALPDLVKDQIRGELADAGARALATEIQNQMTKDWGSYRVAEEGKVPVTSAGVPYNSPRYLEKLAEQVSRIEAQDANKSWHRVRPLVGAKQIAEYFQLRDAMGKPWYSSPFLPLLNRLDEPSKEQPPAAKLLSIEELFVLPGIGQVRGFPELRAFYAPFLSPQERQSLRQYGAEDLELWAPSLLPLRDDRGNIYVHRIVEAEPDAPAKDYASYPYEGGRLVTVRGNTYLTREPAQTELARMSALAGKDEPTEADLAELKRLVFKGPSLLLPDIYRDEREEVVDAVQAYWGPRKQVEKDHVAYQEFQLAKEAATKAWREGLEDHKKDLAEWEKSRIGSPPQAIVAIGAIAGKRAEFPTVFFKNRSMDSLPELGLDIRASQQFIKGAFSLQLEKLKSGRERPVGLIEVPRGGMVLVAQLEKAMPARLDPSAGQAELAAISGDTIKQSIVMWLDPQAIRERMQFTPSKDAESTVSEGQAPTKQEIPRDRPF